MTFAQFVFGIRDWGAEIRSIGSVESTGDNWIEDGSEDHREKSAGGTNSEGKTMKVWDLIRCCYSYDL